MRSSDAADGQCLTLSSSAASSGKRLKQISDQPIVGDLKNRRLLILVDGDDHLAVFHSREMLDRAGNSDSDIEVGCDNFASLPHLLIVGHEAGIDGGARGADARRSACPQVVRYIREVVAASHTAAAGNDYSGRRQLRTVGFGDLFALET